MTTVQIGVTVALVALTTAAIRFAPFLLFPNGKKVPDFVQWLGKQLPRAVMAMLVIYCLKDVSFSQAADWIPALVGVAVTAAVHVWKKQMILSISAGTIIYMVLLRLL
jgi:branched-subunit amino acid transport protein AzlD